MDIVNFKLGQENEVLVGIPGEGSIQCILTMHYTAAASISESELHINGYMGDSKYRFFSGKVKGFETIEIEKSIKNSIELPKVQKPREMKMPDEAKLEWYNKLKEELENKGLI